MRMNSRKPNHIPLPELDSYPFINIMFFREIAGFSNEYGSYSPDFDAWKKLSDEYFDFPASVRNEHVAPLQAMTDTTFELLFALLRPSIYDTIIRTKADLEALAFRQSHRYVVDEEADCMPYSAEQLQTYLLFHCDMTKNVQWAKIANLYNDSTPDQKEAIYRYFESSKGKSLDGLCSLDAPCIRVPECLTEEFQTRTENGNTYLFSDAQQKWLRDDRFYQQYRVDIVLTSINGRYLIAGAPTLKQAIAIASVHVQTDEGLNECWRVDISQNAMPLAHATVVSIPTSVDKALKLRWHLDQMGADNTYITGIKKAAMGSLNIFTDGEVPQIKANIEKLEKLIDTPPPVSREDFTQAVYAVEKALGLQWSKVQKLEDELGL